MPDHSAAIERLRERVQTSDDISDQDGEALLEMSDQIRLLASKYSDARHEKLLRHGVIMAEKAGPISAALESRDEAERIVRWINRNYENEETNRDYRIALRMFGKHAAPGDDKPDSIEWIPTGTSKNYDPSPEESDMLHWEDHILPMINACQNARDRALIAVAWDAGPRAGELTDLTLGAVNDHKYGLSLTLDGKVGKRSVVLIPSVSHLQTWLKMHPAEDDPDAPLWSKLGTTEGVSYNHLRQTVLSAADQAGVTRPVNFTNFRKSSASYLASQGVSQSHLEAHHGWKRGSQSAARYISTFGDATDREIAEAHGKDVEDLDDDGSTEWVDCPRCGTDTLLREGNCTTCGQALTHLGDSSPPAPGLEECEFCGAWIESYKEHLPLCSDAKEAITD